MRARAKYEFSESNFLVKEDENVKVSGGDALMGNTRPHPEHEG